MSFNVERTDNGHLWKVDLKSQVPFGHISEMEFSARIRRNGLQSLTTPQQMKLGADNEILRRP